MWTSLCAADGSVLLVASSGPPATSTTATAEVGGDGGWLAPPQREAAAGQLEASGYVTLPLLLPRRMAAQMADAAAEVAAAAAAGGPAKVGNAVERDDAFLALATVRAAPRQGAHAAAAISAADRFPWRCCVGARRLTAPSGWFRSGQWPPVLQLCHDLFGPMFHITSSSCLAEAADGAAGGWLRGEPSPRRRRHFGVLEFSAPLSHKRLAFPVRAPATVC
jgi:hypothetical protein